MRLNEEFVMFSVLVLLVLLCLYSFLVRLVVMVMLRFDSPYLLVLYFFFLCVFVFWDS